MSVLVILIPPRARLGATRPAADVAAPPAQVAAADGYEYVLSNDGFSVATHGRARPAQWPRADSMVAVLADTDVGWQRIDLPKAPASRLRAALGGLLEERLLEDDEALHLALAPGAQAGQPAWVAVLNKAWLRKEVETLESAGAPVERVLPSAWPGDAAQGHFFEAPSLDAGPGRIVLHHVDANGSQLMRLDGSLARAQLPQMQAEGTHWTATPAVAAPAERWLGSGVTVLSDAQRALQATRSLWNLRQFDLAPRRRGTLALRGLTRRALSPAWRPVRVGVVALLVAQLAGLNAWAWQQRQALTSAQKAQADLLRTTFPNVRAVLDAPLQMQRETDALRAAAGRAGDNDLEALLGAAASAWPEAQGAVQALRFEPGKLTLSAPGWSDAQMEQFRARLRPLGFAVEASAGRVTLARTTGAGP